MWPAGQWVASIEPGNGMCRFSKVRRVSIQGKLSKGDLSKRNVSHWDASSAIHAVGAGASDLWSTSEDVTAIAEPPASFRFRRSSSP
ncbi:hypothetical protein CSOJ01_08743 [Colletotrichum sojae]|uniref:Uncharacterized protein n=1 Tax=Colletotrichum sojae TaxID=2175907 RepID=A0A8H6J4V9_9PEZI|nr:hypothetical protein CSOJ01_08743 [Colletotrichum sojae]